MQIILYVPKTKDYTVLMTFYRTPKIDEYYTKPFSLLGQKLLVLHSTFDNIIFKVLLLFFHRSWIVILLEERSIRGTFHFEQHAGIHLF